MQAVRRAFAVRATFTSASRRGIAYKSVTELSTEDLEGKRVFVRADLNTPLAKEGPRTISDDTRIVASLPTVKHLTQNGAQVVLSSHLGRPKDGPEEKFDLSPVAARISELLAQDVAYCDDCIGDTVTARLDAMNDGEVALLENVRFYKEETKNDLDFARMLSHNADVYVNDAFGAAHRAHASTTGVAQFIPTKVAGILMKKELDFLIGAIENPVRPFAAVVGGSKVSTKITVLRSLMEKCDKILIGGGMAFTFAKAQGGCIGASLLEEDQMELALELVEEAKAKGVQFVLPRDAVAGDKFTADASSKVVPTGGIPNGWMGMDLGPEAISEFSQSLADCRTVVWNGPMGVFEFDQFSAGTREVANCIAGLTSGGCVTVVGGGDSVAAVQKYDLGDAMSHISTGGGASLELLEGKVLPGVACLDTK